MAFCEYRDVDLGSSFEEREVVNNENRIAETPEIPEDEDMFATSGIINENVPNEGNFEITEEDVERIVIEEETRILENQEDAPNEAEDVFANEDDIDETGLEALDVTEAEMNSVLIEGELDQLREELATKEVLLAIGQKRENALRIKHERVKQKLFRAEVMMLIGQNRDKALRRKYKKTLERLGRAETLLMICQKRERALSLKHRKIQERLVRRILTS